MKLEFYQQIFGKYAKSSFMKFRPMRVEFFHVDGRSDGQTDMMKQKLSKKLSSPRIIILNYEPTDYKFLLPVISPYNLFQIRFSSPYTG